MSLYLYALTRATEVPELRGLDKAPVRLISNGSIAALASRFERSKVRPRRRHLLAHDQTIRSLMASQGILPMSFGTLAASREDVLSLLDEHADSVSADLDRLQGRVEMVARTRIAADNLFERCVTTYPELRRARDQMLADGAGQDRDRMLEVGKLFETLREREREQVREQFLAGLGTTFDEVEVNDPKADEQIFDLAFLIHRDGVTAWERAVEQVAVELADDLVIDLAGPLPPYSFTTLRLSAPGAG
ncbi:MAG: GvpL/GvpF family gas vesicle protein [Acidobacteriota bacterium]